MRRSGRAVRNAGAFSTSSKLPEHPEELAELVGVLPEFPHEQRLQGRNEDRCLERVFNA